MVSSCPLTPEFPFHLELTTVYRSFYGLYMYITVAASLPYSHPLVQNCPIVSRYRGRIPSP